MSGIEQTHGAKGKSVVTLVITSTDFEYCVSFMQISNAVFRKLSDLRPYYAYGFVTRTQKLEVKISVKQK
jgi:hypothetical protein